MNKEHEKIAKRNRQPYTIFSVIGSLFILLLNLGGVIAWVDLYLHKGHEYGWIWIVVCGLVVLFQLPKLYKYIKWAIS